MGDTPSLEPEPEPVPARPASRANPAVTRGASLLMLGVVALGGAFAGLCVFTFTYAEGMSYFSKDSRSCINCHVMQDHFDSWLASSHTAVASCTDCHLPHEPIRGLIAKADNGFFHSWAFTFMNFHEPIRIKERNLRILEKNCVDCHSDLVHELLPVTPQDSVLSCVRCHADVGHAAWRRR